MRMFKDLVWGDYISTWPPEDERITEIMAVVAIFIAELSWVLPFLRGPSLACPRPLAIPGEIQELEFLGSRFKTYL